MKSISLTELLDRLVGPDNIVIPNVRETTTSREAAHQYAESGLYLVPIAARTKHPGSILGKGWPDKSSRDHTVLEQWFGREDRGIALHTGRSRLIVFDVDKPSLLPRGLKAELERAGAPFQASDRTPGKGHHIFRVPPGRTFGTSKGRFEGGWGDVRGGNSVIVLCPSVHARAYEGAQYRWIRTGAIPELPKSVADGLPERTGSASASSAPEHEDFLRSHTGDAYPELLPSNIRRLREKLVRGSRHTACMTALVVMFKDAAAGLYSARDAQSEIERAFRWAKPVEEWSSNTEFHGMALYASGIVRGISNDEIRDHRESMLMARDYMRFRQQKGGAQ